MTTDSLCHVLRRPVGYRPLMPVHRQGFRREGRVGHVRRDQSLSPAGRPVRAIHPHRARGTDRRPW
jgi:hypothetical protein